MLPQKRLRLLACLGTAIFLLVTACLSSSPYSQRVATKHVPLTPTATATLAATASLTTIPKPTETSTPTIATLSPTEGREVLFELLRNNGGCQLPCWWGIVPGQTSWEETKTFFSQFDSEIWFHSPFAEVKIPKLAEFYDNIRIWARFTLRDNRISSMEVQGLWYLFPEFLREFGKPEEVWIKTYSQDAGERIPFVLLLFYPSRGFAAAYDDDVIPQPAILRACLEGKAYLFLWEPEKKITFAEFGEMFEWDVTEATLSVHEALGMDVETFYQEYKDALSPACLETPRDLWPNPFSP